VSSSLKLDFQEGDLTSLHPHELIIYLRGISIGKTLYEGLTRIDQDGKAILAGAKSVDVSLDGLMYIFKLRENYWSDGSPVTAMQYESAWKEALSPLSSCKRSDLLYMLKNAAEAKKGESPLSAIGVKAIDEETLLVELARPSPHFLELLAQPIAAPLQNTSEKKVRHFNGPFFVDKWERGSLLQLKPNPYFWNRQSVAIPQIDIYMVQEPETAYALYEQKEIDWIGVPLCPLSTEQIDHLKQKKSLQSHPIERAFWIFLNTEHISLSSAAIRKALSLAIDRETITDKVLIGGDPLTKPLPQALLPHASDAAIKENLPLARELFEQGLKELDLSKKNFPPLVITYSQQANRKQLAEYLQQAWSQAFGIEVELQPQEWNILRTNLGTGDFEITGCFEASYYHDPLELMERMVSLNASNFPRWISPLYQEKISSAGQMADPEERLALLSEAEDILLDQMPFIPVSSDRFLFAHHPKLKGYTFDSVGAIDFSYASMR
jgi:oligopeptide transport system substrate-binding protein